MSEFMKKARAIDRKANTARLLVAVVWAVVIVLLAVASHTIN